MLKNIIYSFFILSLINVAAYAQLPDFTQMVKKYGAAVVNISTIQKTADLAKAFDNQPALGDIPPELEELFKHFFREPEQGIHPRETRSSGSGFIISADGFVLSNYHVVKNADEIVVKLADRRQLIAKLTGFDEKTDIALLKVDASDLPTVKIGQPAKLAVGEWVLAIGTPFGFEQSVTSGIVSAKGRSLPSGNYVPFIQTDVAINPGNSGGPLFNMAGEVVGINSQIYSRSGGYMGLSFAIPIDVAMNVVEQIKSKGLVTRGWLGVQIQDVTRQLAESFDMDRPYGALIAEVVTGSPSETAGLQIGDVIIEFDGQVIDSSFELPPIVGMTPIGKKIKLKIIREGKKQTVEVVIGLLVDEPALASVTHPKKELNRLAIVVSNLTNEQRKQLELPELGVMVENVSNGPALNAGIQPSDIILRIQNNVVRDVASFEKIVKALSANRSIAVLIQRQGNRLFLALKIAQ